MNTSLKGESFEERTEDQLQEWAKGNSIHNHVDEQCCPDFSCCTEGGKATAEERDQFMRLYRAGGLGNCMALMGDFLGRAIASKYPDKNIAIKTPIDGQN